MRRLLPLAALVALSTSCVTAARDTGDDGQAGAVSTKAQAPFPDYIDQLPSDWATYSKYDFKLSQSYPTTPPAATTLPWTGIDFKSDPDGYVLALRDYVFDGFLHPDDPDADFRPELNTKRGWFHVPWMHVGIRGREGLHGLTRELDAKPGRYGSGQTQPAQDVGVGMYNDIGGYTIGQVWKDHLHPDPSASRFAEGALVFKILWTDADPTAATALAGAPEWKAHVATSTALNAPRAIRSVHLAQMDIAVKDHRAPGGWVYTTLVYDVNAPDDAAHGAYGKMMPVGVAYGNDPGVAPGSPLSETVVARRIPLLAKTTLGYGGRLNGPGDNPASACLSCHQTAEWPSLSRMQPPFGADLATTMQWFRNLAPGEAFDGASAQSLDTSLQIAISIANFTAQQNAVPKGPVGGAQPADGLVDLYDPNARP